MKKRRSRASGRGLRCLLLVATAATLLVPPTLAQADGLPILGVDASRTGLTDSSGSRYVTLAADRNTVVARIEVRGGAIARSRTIKGRFTIPAVAYDGSPSGLSADGKTLVVVQPRVAFPQRQTNFAAIDTGQLRVRDLVRLEGDFSFDAISPDGSTVYLIRYPSRRNLTRYEVRAFDLRSGRLLPEPIVDPEEPDEQMAGLPVTRANSPDGRWAYTLYEGKGHEPFIHALDTAGQQAVCIDLPQLESQRNLFTLALQMDPQGRRLTVLNGQAELPGSEPLLSVDTSTFEVSKPSSIAPADGGGPPWLSIGALGVVLGVGFALVAFGKRGSTESESLEHA